MANVGIVGYGYVGSATARGFAANKKNKIFWYDKYKESPNTLEEVLNKSEFIFLCLPTPMFRDYSGMDMGIISRVVDDIAPKLVSTDKVIIVKSTVLPGTTASFAKRYPHVDFAMNPEFLTQKKAKADFLNPARTVIGAKKKDVAMRIEKLYRTILPKDQIYFLTDTTSAEIVKYMSNLMLASKIILANEFYFLAKRLKVDYDQIRIMVEADKRVGPFLKVPGWDGDFGFGQACFPKDMLGLLAFSRKKNIDMSVLDAVWKKNLKIRKHRDWETKDNAFGRGASKKRRLR
jgi:UDPglucose 6-dehydrogenase